MPRHFATERAKRNNYDYRNDFDKKTYKTVRVALKRSEDSDIIAWLEEKKRAGESLSSVVKMALIRYYEKSK